MRGSTTSAEFFESKYRESKDPWDFAGSEYERFRYEATVAALDKPPYGRAFEPGCSIGELTWRLANLCGHVDAMDISCSAVERARRRCRDYSNITFHAGSLPHHIPNDEFDLIVFSEIGYYFEEADLRQLGSMLVRRIRESGTLLAVHWLGISNDHLLSGDRVHEVLGCLEGLKLTLSKRHAEFRLDRWIRI
jgi:cyclopropane fatty-acyl-phospholipid synthase-like methyltransferase